MAGSAIQVVLDGGLANQLFQRAAAFVVARRTGADVKLNPTWLGTGRRLGVTPRSLEIPLSSQDESRGRLPGRTLVNLVRRSPATPGLHWIVESAPDDDALARVDSQTRLVFGFHQRAGNVEEVWDEMVAYLAGDARSAPMVQTPCSGRIVVHVRLGDYVSNPSAARTHRVPEPEYYVGAIGRLIDEGLPAEVTLVSDEPEKALAMVRSGGLGPEVSISASRGSTGWADLATISAAAGVVMSNSSYSCWGAYVASRMHDAAVIYPRQWFADPQLPAPPLLLPDWVPAG